MRAVIALLIAGCAHSPPVVEKTPCPAPAPAPAPVVAPATAAVPAAWDDAKVIEKSQAFLAAADTYARPSAVEDPAMITFSGGRTYDAAMVKRVATRLKEHHLPPQTRTCDKQRVLRTESTMMYFDRCEITTPAHDDVPQLTYSEYD
ncbi:MAG TPA: hypothetical protein VMZ53_16675, partial [Kofleriaceae bacterium]|nr:hypothetical protein [Kofleriaceae bacterium]